MPCRHAGLRPMWVPARILDAMGVTTRTTPDEGPVALGERYVEIVLNLPVPKGFHYGVPEGIPRPATGARVRVPFGRRREVGFCVGHPVRPDFEPVKDILEVLDEKPLVLPSILELTRWIGEYYGCSWGEALQAALPGGVRRGASGALIRIASLCIDADKAREEIEAREGRFPAQARAIDLLLAEGGRAPLRRIRQSMRSSSPIHTLVRQGILRLETEVAEGDPYMLPTPAARDPVTLTEDQERILGPILEGVRSEGFRAFLLHGVTGSGKTEIYIRAIQETLRCGRGAILLVPEISLTPQTVRWFRERMPSVAVLHSHLSDGQRADQWNDIARGRARVVIGSRSAVFAPVHPLGLIIVDEEHEGSFKQDSTPRYHARDVAIVRASHEGAIACLGSATPSLESYKNAIEGKYTLLRLENRVTPHSLPEVEVVDMAAERDATRKPSILSALLRERMHDVLSRGEQVILFLNRRGFATLLRCARCGYVLRCRQCDISLNYHRSQSRAVCHYCFYRVPVGQTCSECVTGRIQALGMGTEKVMESVGRHFPDVTSARMDSDTMQANDAYRKTLSRFESGEIKILVGT
ncbi:MAG: primosomal protein N', partial [Planctomycetota bacterium]|nr:primosomal protein N' [Planctomycetota bacterium]